MDAEYWSGKRILVTGGAGFIGSYVTAKLQRNCGVSASSIRVPRSKDCDLRELENCRRAVDGCQIVIHLAAVTGGISFSRSYPATQYHDSTLIDLNMIRAAREAAVEKFVAIGNLFAYAADAPIPLEEESLFNGLPTDAHRGVGWMKRNLALYADLYHREHDFPMVVLYSANGYGPRDSVDIKHAHVIPSTIMKCLTLPDLIVWGDGKPTRDFLHADDIAAGLILAAERLAPPQYVNLGSGSEISIGELVTLVTNAAKYTGKVSYDVSKVGGDARRCTSIAKARALLGFQPRIGISDGIDETVRWYEQNYKPAKG